MKTQCPNCSETTELTFAVDWKNFACPQCQTLYEKGSDGSLTQLKLFPKTTTPLSLHIGQQGVIEDVLWEVGAICIKYPEHEPAGWREYTLYNADREVCFLSEYNGHWALATEIETGEEFNIFGIGGQTYNGETYPVFNDGEYDTVYAAGFFDYPVPEHGKVKDFINPPFALFLEKNGKEDTCAFEARHFPEKELTAAFPDINLPPRFGHGSLEPFHINLVNFGITIASVGGFIVLCQILLSGFYPTYQAHSDYLLLPDSVAEVSHVSRSFTVRGTKAPLQIDLSAPVNNSWAAVDFCLVNEDTKEERFGAVDVAYYEGIDQGERWSEGDANPRIKICGVDPGRYHLTMQVTKEPNKPALNSLRYSVTAQAFSVRNTMWSLVFLLISVLLVFFWRSQFEKERWMNSDYPPETEEE